MVGETKQFIPDDWKEKTRKIAEDHAEKPERLYDAILSLVDECVSEAVLTLLAEMADPEVLGNEGTASLIKKTAKNLAKDLET